MRGDKWRGSTLHIDMTAVPEFGGESLLLKRRSRTAPVSADPVSADSVPRWMLEIESEVMDGLMADIEAGNIPAPPDVPREIALHSKTTGKAIAPKPKSKRARTPPMPGMEKLTRQQRVRIADKRRRLKESQQMLDAKIAADASPSSIAAARGWVDQRQADLDAVLREYGIALS